MSLFKKPSELAINSTIKVLVYGAPGMGKSTLGLSAPSPVLLDFDGGVQRVNGAFQVPTLQVEKWELQRSMRICQSTRQSLLTQQVKHWTLCLLTSSKMSLR